MNAQHHLPHGALKSAFTVADKLKPLKKKRDPAVAAACGFFLGGIGLGLYLESWLDFVIPFLMFFAIAIIAIPTGETLTLLTPFFWAVWGYRRATASNAKLNDCQSIAPVA